ncbi:hypothetical protein LLS1_04830 [Leifsonia sp. LS1]|uniref:hypothetical protein n=1 Tax=Leifsonia sp. LS1 TaxID=2828483 RepID=UPI001CFE97C5|nr:hypothetical protein [Leifsonia sp. LS1]GIT78814.1 hypothetical protein LLS1_04830 [Leifsonia sp. LS1]
MPADKIDVVVAAACGRAVTDDVERRALEAAGLSGARLSAPKSLFGDAGASSALLGVLQAIWMRGVDSTDVNGFALVDAARSGAGGPVHRVLVSSFEVGGSYQSLVVATDHA